MDRGKLAILAMVVLACGLGLTSVVYHRWTSQGVLAWWGGDMARLIADAPRVEALQLEPAKDEPADSLRVGEPADSLRVGEPADSLRVGEPADSLRVGGKLYAVVQRKNVTAEFGLEHLRRGLLDDGNFVWPAAPASSAVHWEDALVFSDGARRLVVVFDLADRRLGRADASTTLAIDQVATGWEEFFAEIFPRGTRTAGATR